MSGKKKYKVSPINTHVSPCVHEEMTMDNTGTVWYEKWLFIAENYPCGGCKLPDDVVFMRTSPLNVVVRSCKECGVTQPVSTSGSGSEQAESLEKYIISNPEDIREFIKRNKIGHKFVDERIMSILKRKRRRRRVKIEDLNLETEE